MVTFVSTFGGEQRDDTEWTFDLTERFNGAFGGTNGGALSAISVYVARQVTNRRTVSVDSRYLRGFKPGQALVKVVVLSSGRTLSTVVVTIEDQQNRICTHSTVSLVQEESLITDLTLTNRSLEADLPTPDMGKRWPRPKPPMVIPLIDTFEPTNLARTDDSNTIASRVVFSEPGTYAEASCIAADLSVGPPVARIVRGKASTPNPDLSLRFCGEVSDPKWLTSRCSVPAVYRGLAATEIQVWHQATLLATGVSSTTCIPFS